MGWTGSRAWSRLVEAGAKIEALAAISYAAPIDADGNPLRGGSYARVFSAGEGVHRDDRRDEHLAAEAWAMAHWDGGYDADGEADDDWIAAWAERRRRGGGG